MKDLIRDLVYDIRNDQAQRESVIPEEEVDEKIDHTMEMLKGYFE